MAVSPLRPIPQLIFMSRWLQLPLYLGLIVAQAVYVWHFWVELTHLVQAAFGSDAALQTILDHGYVDTLRSVNPQRARTDGSFSTQYPGQRVDYIYTHGIPSGKIKAAWIEQDRLAKYASDHVLIGAEIE